MNRFAPAAFALLLCLVGCQPMPVTWPLPLVDEGQGALAQARVESKLLTPTLSPTVAPSPSATATRTPTVTPRPTSTSTPAPPTATATPLPPTASPTSTPAVAVIPVGKPVRLRIPSIGVDAFVEHVATDSEGRMIAPEGVWNVSWYQPGFLPGHAGNAVFAGHFDDYKQEPAVFWRLHEVVVGDVVLVLDEAGVERHFEVVGTEIYPFDQAPVGEIFGAATDSGVALITCNGTWDSHAWNYDKRLVVYTRLVREVVGGGE